MKQNRQKRDGNHSFFFPTQDSASINITVGRGGSAPKPNQMKESTMNKILNGLVGVAMIGSLVGIMPTTALAEPVPTAEERSACTSDAFRLCVALIPNQNAVITCLKSKRSQLSPTCRQLFNRI